MRSDLLLGAFAAAFALTSLAGRDASAFCRTTTVKPPADMPPQMDPCFSQGVPLYHPSKCLPYRLLARDSNVVPNATLSEALARAFATWTAPNATCTPGIAGIELAPANDTVIASYRVGEVGRNLVGVPDTWKYGGSETMALATLTYSQETGEIFDVDLEVNPTIAWSFSETPPADGYDLQSAMTHEVGHMLGIAHSPVVDAAMFAAYEPGSTKQRKLHADDGAAICAAYPNRSQRVTAAGTIPSTACNLAAGSADASCEPDITNGCAVSETGAARGSATGIAVVVAGLALVVGRRRRR